MFLFAIKMRFKKISCFPFAEYLETDFACLEVLLYEKSSKFL